MSFGFVCKQVELGDQLLSDTTASPVSAGYCLRVQKLDDPIGVFRDVRWPDSWVTIVFV